MAYKRQTTDIVTLEFSFAVPTDRDAKLEVSNHLKNIGEMLNDLAEYGVSVNGANDIVQAGKDLTPRGRRSTKKAAIKKEIVIETDDDELPPGFVEDDGPEPPTLDA
jgi:hypothetical protein